jgi:tetratricopeptide (TPR) repeat protein/predicted Ser/Thr protein kinase
MRGSPFAKTRADRRLFSANPPMSVHPQHSETGDGTPGWQASRVVQAPSSATVASARTSGLRGRPLPTDQGSRLGRFWILETLGSGGMGVVLEAYDGTLDRTVALKLLHPWGSEQHRARLLREAKALARLSHPNVVQVYEIGTVDDNTFIAMELVRGQNLRDWSRQRHSWRTIVDVYAQAGEGLAAAHAEGLVHRDFKPENCIIGDNGRVRVLDFGLAREVDLGTTSGDEPEQVDSERLGEALSRSSGDGSLGEPLTVTGTLLGTVAYMSYEQLRGRPADALSDQFSFCASLWEALYGVRAFSGSSPYALVASLKLNRLSPIPEDARVPRRLRQLLVRGLALDPTRRWPSMKALLEQLRAAGRRPRWWRTASLLVAGIGLGGGSLALFGYGQADVCATPEAGLEGTWGSADRAAVQQAFERNVLPQTAPVLRARVMAELDAYAKEWTSQAEAACRATFVTRQQSELSFDRRMRCLARGRNRLRSTIDALATAASGPDLVQRAILAFKLPELHPCADLEALAAELPPLPAEPVQRERAAELRQRIDEAHTLREAGMTMQGIEVATAVRKEAVELDDPLLLAEALECLGRLQAESTLTSEAVDTLAEAVIEAERISADQIAARSWLWMLHALTMEHDLPTARARVLAARAAVERTDDDALRAWWLNNVGILHAESKQLEQADDLLQQALELKSKLYGAGHVDVGIAWFNLGSLRVNANDLEGAQEAFDRAHAIFEATVSAAHPLSAYVESGRCGVAERLGHHAEAIEHCSRALAHFEVSSAPAVTEYRVRVLMADALWGAGRHEQARRTAQGAAALGESIGSAEAEAMRRWLAERDLTRRQP